jgi:hypothetical protein
MSTIRKSKHFIIHIHPNGTTIPSFVRIFIILIHQTHKEPAKDIPNEKRTAINKKNGDQNDTDRRYVSSGLILPSHLRISFQKP